MQFQKVASDCGAYAVAFATDLAYGHNPASEYEQSYGHILSKKQIVPKPIKPEKPKSEYIYIWVSFRENEKWLYI